MDLKSLLQDGSSTRPDSPKPSPPVDPTNVYNELPANSPPPISRRQTVSSLLNNDDDDDNNKSNNNDNDNYDFSPKNPNDRSSVANSISQSISIATSPILNHPQPPLPPPPPSSYSRHNSLTSHYHQQQQQQPDPLSPREPLRRSSGASIDSLLSHPHQLTPILTEKDLPAQKSPQILNPPKQLASSVESHSPRPPQPSSPPSSTSASTDLQSQTPTHPLEAGLKSETTSTQLQASVPVSESASVSVPIKSQPQPPISTLPDSKSSGPSTRRLSENGTSTQLKDQLHGSRHSSFSSASAASTSHLPKKPEPRPSHSRSSSLSSTKQDPSPTKSSHSRSSSLSGPSSSPQQQQQQQQRNSPPSPESHHQNSISSSSSSSSSTSSSKSGTLPPSLPQPPKPISTADRDRRLSNKNAPITSSSRPIHNHTHNENSSGSNGNNESAENTNRNPDKKIPKHYKIPPIWARSWKNRHVYRTPDGKYDTNLNNNSNNQFQRNGHHNQQQHNHPYKNNGNGPMQSPNGGGHYPGGQYSPTRPPHYVSSLPYSLTGVIPYEEITRRVTSWMYAQLALLDSKRIQNVEVEIKLGIIIDKATGKRLRLPILTECILDSQFARSQTAFRASMRDEQYSFAISFLNKLSEQSKHQKKSNGKSNGHGGGGADGKIPEITTLPIQRTRDLFYELPLPSSSGISGPIGAKAQPMDQIRVTLDPNIGVIEQITKEHIDTLVVYLPNEALDFRISFAIENPRDKREFDPEKHKSFYSRLKNRTSFLAPGVRVDVTSVTAEGGPNSIGLDKSMLGPVDPETGDILTSSDTPAGPGSGSGSDTNNGNNTNNNNGGNSEDVEMGDSSSNTGGSATPNANNATATAAATETPAAATAAPAASNNRTNNRKQRHSQRSQELEIEFDRDMLVRNFSNIAERDMSAGEMFEEQVKYAIDNARIIIRAIGGGSR